RRRQQRTAGDWARRRMEPRGMRRLRHRARLTQATLRSLRRRGRSHRWPVDTDDDVVQWQLLYVDRGAVRAQGRAAAPPAHLLWRNGRETHPTDGRPVGQALEHAGAVARRVAPEA